MGLRRELPLWLAAIVMGLQCSSEFVPLQIQVIGSGSPTETGIRNFTVAKQSNGDRFVKLVCISNIDKETTNVSVGGSINIARTTLNTGTYSCQVNTSQTNREYVFLFSMRSEVDINIAKDGNRRCETSVGYSGITGEYARVYCAGNNRRWNSTLADIDFLRLSHYELLYLSCGREKPQGTWIETCRLDNLINLNEQLQVNITPISFPRNDSVLEFTCTSSPPRLMFWEVLGTRGDLLGANYGQEVLTTNVSVTVVQERGNTTLSLEQGPGGNGIHTVRCFTYNTIRVVTEAKVEVGSVDDGTMEQVQQTDGSTTLENRQTASTGLLVMNILLIIIIFILGGVIVLMYHKTKMGKTNHSSKGETTESDTNLSMTSQQHVNLAYEACVNTTGSRFNEERNESSGVVAPTTDLENNPVYESSEMCGGTMSKSTEESEYTYIAA